MKKGSCQKYKVFQPGFNRNSTRDSHFQVFEEFDPNRLYKNPKYLIDGLKIQL